MNQPVVAAADLLGITREGRHHKVRIGVAKPYKDKNGIWRCAVLATGLAKGQPHVCGEDSLQALLLALAFLHRQLTQFLERGGHLYFAGTHVEFLIDPYFRVDALWKKYEKIGRRFFKTHRGTRTLRRLPN